MLKFKDVLSMTDGFFLLLLAVSGNFVAETLGCETQYIFSKNMYVKQLIIFFMIYFTINFSSETSPSPQASLVKAVLLWIFFVLFTKMTPGFTFMVLLILLGVYILNNYKKYLNSKKDKSKDKEIMRMQKGCIYTVILLIILGCIKYYHEKQREYGSKFTQQNFWFGVTSCKSLR